MFRFYTPRLLSLVFITLLIDLTVSPLFSVGSARFFAGYLLVLYATFAWGWQKTIPVAIMVGLSRDFLSTDTLGFETFALAAASFLLDFLVRKMQRELLWLRLILAFLFVLCVQSIQIILSVSLQDIAFSGQFAFGVILGSAFYTALMLPLFFYGAAWWFHDRTFSKQYELFR